MESIIINGKRMIPAHGDHGQILAKTGPMKTSGAFAKCKSTLIHSQNPRALMNGANTRRNMTLVYGNGQILSRKEARSKNDRLRGVNVSIGTGIDPNLASY